MPTLLFCLPFAGGGASFYRAWQAPPSQIRLSPIQLPGREELYTEPYPGCFADMADFAVAQMVEAARDGDRIALFGHSFGAVLAFESARLLTVRHGMPPAHLFVSGSGAPSAQLGRTSYHLDDDEFVGRVEELAGYSHPALFEPELRQILLPVLRSDVALHETFQAVDTTPLPVPITAIRGRDDHLVSGADCSAWTEVSALDCHVAELPGGHMYLAEDSGPLLDLVARELAGLYAGRTR